MESRSRLNGTLAFIGDLTLPRASRCSPWPFPPAASASTAFTAEISFQSLPIAVAGRHGEGRFVLFGGPHAFERWGCGHRPQPSLPRQCSDVAADGRDRRMPPCAPAAAGGGDLDRSVADGLATSARSRTSAKAPARWPSSEHVQRRRGVWRPGRLAREWGAALIRVPTPLRRARRFP